MDRHRHLGGYAALVLAGGYVEAGDHGRFRVEAGQVMFHGTYESHLDEFSSRGATVLNLPTAGECESAMAVADEVDAIATLAERDLREAGELLRATARPLNSRLNDWPDELATALASECEFSLTEWAEHMGVAPQSLSRGFRRAYGTSPKRYRAELRALRAVRLIPDWRDGIAALAVETGFADQAHLSRAVVHLTGMSPKRLKVQSVQESARLAR